MRLCGKNHFSMVFGEKNTLKRSRVWRGGQVRNTRENPSYRRRSKSRGNEKKTIGLGRGY